MGLRKYKREIARTRLAEMGMERINDRFGYGMPNSVNRRLHRTARNKELLAEYQKQKRPAWWRVLYGDLAKMYWKEKHRREQLAFRQKMAYYQNR